ncbi:MAG: hypothetical protein WC657_06085 [Candidatus Paceibacterota bacterium]|jgi:hypothetical protein
MNGIPNAYAEAPAEPWVNPDDATYKAQLHEQAAVLIERAHAAQCTALDLLNEATRVLDNAERVYDGDSGLDSSGSRAQVVNAADALEMVDLDFADEVRSYTR